MFCSSIQRMQHSGTIHIQKNNFKGTDELELLEKKNLF